MSKIGEKSWSDKSIKELVSPLWPLGILLFVAVYYLYFAFFDSFGLFDFTFADNTITLLASWLTIIPFCFVLHYGFFKLFFRYFGRHLKDKKGKLRMIALFMFLPLVSTILFNTYTVNFTSLGDWIGLLFRLGTPAFAALVAFDIIPFRKDNPFSRPKAPNVALLVFGTMILLSVLESYLKAVSPAMFWDVFDGMFLPIWITQLVLVGISSIIFSYLEGFDWSVNFPTPETDQWIITFSASAILLVGSLIVLLAKRRKSDTEKKWQTALGVMFIILSAYILLPLIKIPETEVEWQVPIRNISKDIEKDEMGYFYHSYKQLGQKSLIRPSFYDICSEENTLKIKQMNYDKLFSIDVSNPNMSEISTVKAEESLAESESFCDTDIDTAEYVIQEEFTCTGEGVEFPAAEAYGEKPCEKLFYNGKEIFNRKHNAGFDAPMYIALSENKDWALISIQNFDLNFYNDVYLVDLRGLR